MGNLWGQIAAIILVLAAGIMTLVVSVGTVDALKATQSQFYETQRFAEVFASLKRAPNDLLDRISRIQGLDQIETRIQIPARLAVSGFNDPIRGLMVSLPDGAQPNLGRLYLQQGRLPSQDRLDEVVLSDGFALAHQLAMGDKIEAIIQGRKQTLLVTGIALSPEFIYQRSPADLFPDHLRYGVVWMNRRGLENAAGMSGAFNQLVATLQPNAHQAEVLDAIDQIIKPFGGLGAHGRNDHMSHRFLAEEIKQLSVMGTALPVIFLGVASFLLNVLIGRLLKQQRQDIAMLKAFGYTPLAIGWHYAKLTAAIVILGVSLGTALGAWASHGMADLYLDFFRFPSMQVGLSSGLVAQGLLIATMAGFLGTWRAIHRIMRLPPAQAMQPPSPTQFRASWLARSPLVAPLSQPARMIIRNLDRHRFKVMLSVIGIALSGALLLVGSYQFAATDRLLDVQFRLIEKADLRLVFSEPTSASALVSLRDLPGHLHAEGYRQLPIRLIHGPRDYGTSLLGIPTQASLHRLLDESLNPYELPSDGLVISDYLASMLAIEVGDQVWVEILEGEQRIIKTAVVDTVADWVGVSAYMNQAALNQWLGEGPVINGAWMLIDESRQDALFEGLWAMPKIAGIGVIHLAETQIREFIRDSILVMMGILLLMAGGIAFGVIYNNARLSFSERARELATLRVLGYSQREVAFILIGEIILLTLVAIPLGWLVGWLMANALSQTFSMELMRIPFVITKQAYAISALGVMVASLISVGLMLPRLRKLDMVMALKTVE